MEAAALQAASEGEGGGGDGGKVEYASTQNDIHIPTEQSRHQNLNHWLVHHGTAELDVAGRIIVCHACAMHPIRVSMYTNQEHPQ